MLPVVSVKVSWGSLKVTKKNEGVLPPHEVPVGGRLCQFVEGWKRITNDPYFSSIVAKLQTPGEIRFRRFIEDSGKGRANIPNALEERNLGLRSRLTASTVFEAPTMTFSFIRSGKPV